MSDLQTVTVTGKWRLPPWLAGGPEVSQLAYRIVLHTFRTITEPAAPRDIAEITMGDIVGHLAATLDADEADVLRALAELQQVGALETDR